MFVEENQRCNECEGVLKPLLEKFLVLVPVFHGVKPQYPQKKYCCRTSQMKRLDGLNISLLHTSASNMPSWYHQLDYGFYLLLRALGVGEGDEVIIPALTYYAIPAMAPLTGAKVVLADIELNSHVLDPDAFEAAITERTKAVVPTHLFGTPCDMGRINEIAKKHGLK